MIVKLKKGDKCPICDYKILAPNCWVRFHVKYDPPIVILACKYCNYVEYCRRNGYKYPMNYGRNSKLISYMSKFSIDLGNSSNKK